MNQLFGLQHRRSETGGDRKISVVAKKWAEKEKKRNER